MATKFFLIDDDSDDRELFSEALAAVDNSIVCYYAEDGEDAIEKLYSKRIDKPDVIFLDINLPAMTGWQCLDKIKTSADTRDVPVIMYSTSSHTRDKNLARGLGALCLVTKPHDYKEIKNLLSTVATSITKGDIDAICRQLSV